MFMCLSKRGVINLINIYEHEWRVHFRLNKHRAMILKKPNIMLHYIGQVRSLLHISKHNTHDFNYFFKQHPIQRYKIYCHFTLIK